MDRLMWIAAALSLAVAIPALAQSGPTTGLPGSSPTIGSGSHMGQNNMTQDQFNQLSDYVDQAHRLTASDRAHGKTEADLKAEDIANGGNAVKALGLACEVSDAQLFAQGTQKVNGQTVTSHAYEVACSNGMGYLVVAQEPGQPFGLSCFAAEAKRADEASHGRNDAAVCRLAANADLKAVAGAVLSHTGKTCSVRAINWLGYSPATNTDYNEVACADSAGFVLATAAPGSTAQPRVDTCHDSSARGIRCTLTVDATPAAPAITTQTFKDALAQHNVACEATDVRVVGQQNASKRYVVEFRCPQQPKGLVALIPLAGNTQPFQTMDCVAAAKIGAPCKLHGAP